MAGVLLADTIVPHTCHNDCIKIINDQHIMVKITSERTTCHLASVGYLVQSFPLLLFLHYFLNLFYLIKCYLDFMSDYSKVYHDMCDKCLKSNPIHTIEVISHKGGVMSAENWCLDCVRTREML